MSVKSVLRPLALASVMLAITAGAPEARAETKYVTIGASGSGGTYNIIAAAVAKVVNARLDKVQMTVESTPGGGRGNVRLLGNKQIDFGLATVADAVAAYRGTDAFEGSKLDGLRILLVGTDLPFQFAIKVDSAIKSLSDFKGKKVTTNSSANALKFVPDALKSYGLDKDKSYELIQYSTTEAMEAFKDGRVDAFGSFFFMPASALVDVATTHDVRFLGFDEEHLEKLVATHDIYSPSSIPAGTYPKQDSALIAPAIAVAIFTHEGVDPALVHDVAKAIIDGREDLDKVYKPATSFSLERQRRWVEGAMVPPYHEGSDSLLRELKVLN